MAFHSLEEIQKSCREKNVLFWRAVLLEDMADRSVTETESMQSMQQMWTAMKSASEQYDRTQVSASGLVGKMGAQMEEYRQSKEPLCGPFVSKVIARALEMGESNACMKRIVAAPTAGACGVLPAVLVPLYEEERVSEDEVIHALYTAAGIGQVIASRAFIAGAAGGCQAEESLKLALHYEVDSAMVYTVAAYHDLGLCEGREFHHIVSGRILLADEILHRWFTDEQMLEMKEAIEDHRASNKQAPRSIYGKIVAEADRIIDPEITLRRTVQYGLSHYPEMDKEQQYERFRKHLADKYAEGGYLKLWIPQSDNAGRLAELRHLIANEEKLREVFNKLYLQEKD